MIHEKRDEKWRLWTHAALMAGREFCYSLEIVSVTPVMKTLGLPDQEKVPKSNFPPNVPVELDSPHFIIWSNNKIIYF